LPNNDDDDDECASEIDNIHNTVRHEVWTERLTPLSFEITNMLDCGSSLNSWRLTSNY